ncbi:MAG TPA: SDR family NAD(P)-dependent oxidoreductase [Henriciella marina]|uniref:SDR family NAD(P)-dependent oxidoreductase n=1 Tax=Henriciella sp. TaxID=1968823 RepID=UPI00183D1A2E|nr:SDR family NAD(P)-dependent oxidoreductase [Henriciella sp.]HIG21117.1 SDR family NAD(P)-dependent oxidoreductase [Henriciella sp.]HIK65708.1 SDR family NAD(P)-dependent oxidoreductase [Henriciella marina]
MSRSMSPSRRQLLLGAGAAALAASTVSGASAQSGSSEAMGLAGKSILITGTSSGFGRLGAEHFARLGAKVFATMRNLPRPEADELRTLAEAEDLDITVIEIDITSDEQVAAGVAEAEAAAGGALDILINNAGIAMSGPIEVQDLEATKLMFDTNVFGAQRMIRAALPAMREAGRGQIFNVTSQLGRLIIPGLGQYSPTKFALEALSEQLAYETVDKGIEVTIIQPGGYPTEIWQSAADRSGALKQRTRDPLLAAYPQLTAGMGQSSNGGGSTDPMDVPRAIAEIIMMPAGQRPLRKPVHPAAKPQIPINEVSAQQQLAMLGNSGYGPWLRAVLKNAG